MNSLYTISKYVSQHYPLLDEFDYRTKVQELWGNPDFMPKLGAIETINKHAEPELYPNGVYGQE